MTGKTIGKAIGELIYRKRHLAGLTQLELALEAFEDETKIRRIVELEKGYVARPQAKTTGPIFKVLNISEEEVAECLSLQTVSSAVQADLGLSPAAVENLASLFEIDCPEGSLLDLVQFLERKAVELRELKARLNAIGDAGDTTKDALSAAQTAIDEGDFDSADLILVKCEDFQRTSRTLIEIRKQAEIRYGRALLELLKGNSLKALEHFNTTATFFDSFDKIEGAKWRDSGQNKLHWHGRFFGGSALEYAEALLVQNSNLYHALGRADDWARSQGELGLTLQFQGMRAAGEPGVSLLKRAINFYELALTVQTLDRSPEEWAKLNTNRATALRFLGSRLRESNGVAYFNQAIEIYEWLLDLYPKEKRPNEWARTQTNLGVCLTEHAKSVGGDLVCCLPIGHAVRTHF
jgi:tetratricopeptide (TPR) repeat protein